MRRLTINCIQTLSALFVLSCSPEVLPVVMDNDTGARSSLKLDISDGSSATKTSLLAGSEDKKSGAIVAVYYSSTGLMDSVQEISAEAIATAASPASEQAVISVPLGQDVEIFVLGNLWAINKNNSVRASLATAYAEDFPSSIEEMKRWSYHIDGRDINESYRHQKLSDVAEYGIPFSGSLKVNVNAGESSVKLNCSRLFAKLRLTVDHSGLDGGKNVDYFKNISLHLRQANGNLTPFADLPSKAVEPSDIIEGDYDAAMENASCMYFDLYLPENMQGSLLPDNNNPDLKTFDNIVTKYGSDLASLLTYVEFTAEVNPDAGGYGGRLTYRFYLGKDNCSNFDIERNALYDLKLGFKLNSLFSPDWKLETDLTDGRHIGICADEARSRVLPEGQMVAVRKNRPARIYPYVIAGQGSAVRKPDGIGISGKYPSDLSECYIMADFLTESDLPSTQKEALEKLGISAFYDEASGFISFVVSDASKFKSGEEVNLSISTLPEGKSTSFRICTFDDMKVEWNGSLTDRFAPGMSRTAVISGFSSSLSYRSTTVHCFKDDAVEGATAIISSSYASNPLIEDKEFTIYNFTCCSASSCMESEIYFRPQDDFNDGNNDGVLDDADAFSFPVVNTWPDVEFKGVEHPTRIELDVAGNEEQIYLELKSFDYSDFDDRIFDMVYMPHLCLRSGESQLKDEEGNILYRGDPDAYIGLSRTGLNTAEGWPIYHIYRNRVGDRYSTREEISYSSYYIAYMPSLQVPGAYYAKYSNYMDISFLPFLSKDFDADFNDEYHDYTFWNPDHLDLAYRQLAENSVSASSGKSVDFGLKDISLLDLYAKPSASSEQPYLENGVSGSISISQQTAGGPLTMSFVESGTEKHTAGPHKVFARFTNKHSGESRDELLGDFLVYVHFIVGLDVEISDYGGSVDFGTINIYPVLMNDVSRCSYSEVEDQLYPQLWVKYGSSFEYYTGNEPSGSYYGTLSFPSESQLIGDRKNAVKVLPESYGYADPVISFSPICSYDAYLYSNIWADANFYMDLCKEEPYMFCELISRKGNYQFCFDNGYDTGTTVYDDTAFSDLRGPDGKGFYHFHLLGEVRADSNDWIPLFEHYVGL